MSELGPIIQALTRLGGREDPAFAFEPGPGHVRRSLNAAFLIILQGHPHPDHARAGEYLEAAKVFPDWGEAARFYLEGASLVAEDTEYFLRKWDITSMIEKLPHDNNSRRWDGRELVVIDLDLGSADLRDDVVTLVGA